MRLDLRVDYGRFYAQHAEVGGTLAELVNELERAGEPAVASVPHEWLDTPAWLEGLRAARSDTR